MEPIVILSLFVGLPIILGIILRVNPIYMYLSVVVGKVLLAFVGDDAAVAASGLIKGQNSQMFSSLFLLVIPLILTMLLLRGSLHKTQILLLAPVFIAVGASLYIFALPQLTAGTIGTVLASEVGKTINSSQDLIIAVSGVIVVVAMWITNRPHHEHHKHQKHHK